jgi:putative hydrolase of the HAD superfamily
MQPGGVAVQDEKWLGGRVQELRKAAHLTQQGLCQKTGLSYSTLAKIERGAIKAPSVFTIANIAEALGISLDELMATRVAADKPRLTTQSGVRFIYFDINGCLVQASQRALTRLADDYALPLDIVETAYWRYNDEVCRGTLSMTDFNHVMADRLRIPEIDWAKYYLESVEIIQPMQDVVNWAAERYEVGLLTNIMPGLVSAMKSRSLLPDVDYRVVVDSSEVGMSKPNPEIFRLAQERAGVAPQEILFIDDTPANLRAAQEFGWHVQLFDDYHIEESTARVRASLEPAA